MTPIIFWQGSWCCLCWALSYRGSSGGRSVRCLSGGELGEETVHGTDRSTFGYCYTTVLSHALGHGERTGRRRPVRRGSNRARAAAARGHAAWQGGGDLRAEWHHGEPNRLEA